MALVPTTFQSLQGASGRVVPAMRITFPGGIACTAGPESRSRATGGNCLPLSPPTACRHRRQGAEAKRPTDEGRFAECTEMSGPRRQRRELSGSPRLMSITAQRLQREGAPLSPKTDLSRLVCHFLRERFQCLEGGSRAFAGGPENSEEAVVVQLPSS
jgi:hypothetical protein